MSVPSFIRKRILDTATDCYNYQKSIGHVIYCLRTPFDCLYNSAPQPNLENFHVSENEILTILSLEQVLKNDEAIKELISHTLSDTYGK